MAEHDSRKTSVCGIDRELGTVVQDEDEMPTDLDRVGLGQVFCPRRGIDIAAHRYHGRDLAQPFEDLGLAHISGMNDQFRPS
jgi:hypothetical protein